MKEPSYTAYKDGEEVGKIKWKKKNPIMRSVLASWFIGMRRKGAFIIYDDGQPKNKERTQNEN